MTEEEYFRKNYPDYCYGDRPLSPYWDYFQDGVEFGERQSEKKIEELEQKLEQTEKDLADYQFNYPKIKELEQENAELRNNGFTVSAMTEQQLKVALEKGEQLEKENAELKKRNAELKGMYAHSAREAGTYKQFLESKEKENAELKKKIGIYQKGMYEEIEKRDKKLTKAKDLIHQFLIQNPISDWLPKKAEQFLKEIEK